ncbi:EAL domain-containing protein [Klebsiella quasivariicola]|uniref:EAL domain-containing protein n=1 Tax=Klebsiella quasivariicola TaxID=2026240 RepID=UPI00247A201D|nr:EAL domain-containing protein [Klebsiella quasivariicola]
MVEENVKNTLYRFVLEPAISDDGSYHSWELLTKDIIAPAQNITSALTFSFSTLTDRDKIALFTRQIELLSVFDFTRLDNKPVSLNIDDLLSQFILTDRYLCDFLRSCKHIALEINENFHEFIAGRELTTLSALAALCPVWLDDFGRGRTSFALLDRFCFDCVKVDKDYFWDKEDDPTLPGLLQAISALTRHVIVEGVETEKQKRLIGSAGNIIGQGRYWKDEYIFLHC